MKSGLCEPGMFPTSRLKLVCAEFTAISGASVVSTLCPSLPEELINVLAENEHNKSAVRLPDREHAKAAVLNSLKSEDAKRGYRHAIDEFVDWYCSESLGVQ